MWGLGLFDQVIHNFRIQPTQLNHSKISCNIHLIKRVHQIRKQMYNFPHFNYKATTINLAWYYRNYMLFYFFSNTVTVDAVTKQSNEDTKSHHYSCKPKYKHDKLLNYRFHWKRTYLKWTGQLKGYKPVVLNIFFFSIFLLSLFSCHLLNDNSFNLHIGLGKDFQSIRTLGFYFALSCPVVCDY